MPRPGPHLFAAALLLACSSADPAAKPDDASARDAVAGGAPASLVIAAGVDVPNLGSAAPIPAGAPQITLAPDGVRVGDRSLITADLRAPATAATIEAQLGAPLQAALEEASKGAADKPLLVIADAEVAFSSLRFALGRAQAAGFERCGLVVETSPGGYAMLPLRIVADAVASGSPDLQVVLQPDGHRVTVGPPPPAEPGAPPPPLTVPRIDEKGGLYRMSNWDLEGLEAKAVELLAKVPERRATVVADGSVRVDDLVVTLLALRGHACAADDDPGCHVKELRLATKVLEAASAGAAEIGVGSVDLGRVVVQGSGPAPKPGPVRPTVEGSLDVDVVRRIIGAHHREIRTCFDAALARDPALRGQVKVAFVVSGAGKVKRASVGEGSIADTRLGACIIGAVKRWTFPSPGDGGEVKVEYPFELVAG